ncbi:hypothetical protein SAMN03097699_2392 [Flavobacteriaceae bacterium MAR_2010_188]|nr:hypothetical protein SAMN03097699_2392 [Flavobacteriaceae bacterium MAR_2010_188]
MKKNIIGAFVIFAVTIAILVLLNNFSSGVEEKPKQHVATKKKSEKPRHDLATNLSKLGVR